MIFHAVCLSIVAACCGIWLERWLEARSVLRHAHEMVSANELALAPGLMPHLTNVPRRCVWFLALTLALWLFQLSMLVRFTGEA